MLKRWEFWVFVALAVGASVLVVVGVATHTEAGLAPLTQDVRWVKGMFPLQIQAVSYSSEGPKDLSKLHKSAISSAIATTNERLGFPAYTWDKTGDMDIDIVVGAPFEQDYVDNGGTYVLRHNGWDFQSCSIRTINTGTQEILRYVLEHELGHCLGLAHDESNMSIMRPIQRTRGEGFPPHITDTDRAMLRGMYAP